VKAVLLDIEGTTTPISFVHDVLFPYARAHLKDFLEGEVSADDSREIRDQLSKERAYDEQRGEHPPEETLAYLEWLMDRDRKSPALKRLQGLIWEGGYRAGVLRGQVFADVPEALRRWRSAGIVVAIYSSGNELAQRRLFESTDHGDLTPLISAFFDTRVGPKSSPEIYRRIAEELKTPARDVQFLSDVTAELSAARIAGLRVKLLVRPGNAAQPGAAAFETLENFERL
jgi:enolase-phosphatase E1